MCALLREATYFPKRRKRIGNNNSFFKTQHLAHGLGDGGLSSASSLLSASLSELWFVQGDAQYGEANELIFIESVHSLNKDGGFGG